MRRQLVVSAFSVTVLLGLCAADPPRKGTEITGGIGTGRYVYKGGGCNGPIYEYQGRESFGYGRIRHRTPRDISVEAEAAYSSGENTSAVPETTPQVGDPPPAETRQAVFGSVRAGRHWDRFGFDLGLSLLHDRDDQQDGLLRTIVFPSFTTWFGRPERAYGYVDFLGGAPLTMGGQAPGGFGVGHKSDRFSGRAGVCFGGGYFEADVPLFEGGPWFGAVATVRNEDEWSGYLRATFPFDAP